MSRADADVYASAAAAGAVAATLHAVANCLTTTKAVSSAAYRCWPDKVIWLLNPTYMLACVLMPRPRILFPGRISDRCALPYGQPTHGSAGSHGNVTGKIGQRQVQLHFYNPVCRGDGGFNNLHHNYVSLACGLVYEFTNYSVHVLSSQCFILYVNFATICFLIHKYCIDTYCFCLFLLSWFMGHLL
ncbi:hypothetical protein BRADI_1g55519v3 [Brachypodium distachyon]|uniref:Uncharacterized protein n=1 Tax=Brachypodium distachyon TaxID=15368 RepID=A0A0Q3LBW1_BRADI|nr:hypothetical protein BRADI_1g55519v3 [Brachypodium distachyon]